MWFPAGYLPLLQRDPSQQGPTWLLPQATWLLLPARNFSYRRGTQTVTEQEMRGSPQRSCPEPRELLFWGTSNPDWRIGTLSLLSLFKTQL